MLLRVGVKAEATLDEIDDVWVDRLGASAQGPRRARPEMLFHVRGNG